MSLRTGAGKRVSVSHPPCKSELMLLSEKFRDRFARPAGDDRESRIDLNDCAIALGVPRRRLYDITIVYEAAEVGSLEAFLQGSLLSRCFKKGLEVWKRNCQEWRKGSAGSCIVYLVSFGQPNLRGFNPQKLNEFSPLPPLNRS